MDIAIEDDNGTVLWTGTDAFEAEQELCRFCDEGVDAYIVHDEDEQTAQASRFGDDVEEFRAYCRTLSDRQVEGVIEKESEFAAVDPFRQACLEVAQQEAANRELDV